MSDGYFRRLWDLRQIAAYGYRDAPAARVPLASVDGLPEVELTTDTSALHLS